MDIVIIMKRGLISLLLLLLCMGSTLAQDASQPLILVKAGDLWEWTGGPMLRQKTQWGYNDSLSLSPLNDEVAYSSLATISTDAIKREGGFGGGGLPNNLWVITTAATDLAYRPANQPEEASFMMPGVPDKALYRSGAMWSPDGAQIAWTETGLSDDGTYQLMIYDKASQTTRTVITGLPTQYGEGAGLYGVWTSKGIVLFSYTYNASVPTLAEDKDIVIDPESGQIRVTVPLESITIGDETLLPMMQIPVQYEDETWMGVLYGGGKVTSQWVIVNLDTGTIQTVRNTPMAALASNPNASLQVLPRVLENGAISYDAQNSSGAILALNTDEHNQISRFALSPDGQAIAYQLYDPTNSDFKSAVYVWTNGSIVTVPQTEIPAIIPDFVWGTSTWFIPQ